MAKQDYVELLSDFLYNIGQAVGFETDASKALFPRVEHALRCVELLYFDPAKRRGPCIDPSFLRRMQHVEAKIAEKLYQVGILWLNHLDLLSMEMLVKFSYIMMPIAQDSWPLWNFRSVYKHLELS